MTDTNATPKRRDRRGQENLDVQITIVSRANILAFLGLTLVAAAVGFCAACGTVPTKAQGNGILLRDHQTILAVQSQGSGRIHQITVDVGDMVQEGDVLGSLDQHSLDAEITATQQAMSDLEVKTRHLGVRLDKEIDRHKTNTKTTVRQINDTIKELEVGKAKIQELLDKDAELLKRGLMTRPRELSDRVIFQNILSRIGELQIQKTSANQALQDLIAHSETQKDEAPEQINLQRRQLNRFQELRRTEKQIIAPISGRVQEIRTAVGHNVSQYDELTTVGGGDRGVEVLAFLDPGQARRIQPGMPVHVVPSSIAKAEFGSIRGIVSFVSTEPVSEANAINLLQNRQLASNFAFDGTQFLTRVHVEENRDTPSGFAWWFGEGRISKSRPER